MKCGIHVYVCHDALSIAVSICLAGSFLVWYSSKHGTAHIGKSHCLHL